jgi:hypothetical protein
VATINRGSVRADLPHEPFTAARVIDRHVQAEYGNQIPEIMPTVSGWDQHFALLSPTPSPQAGLDLILATDRPGVQEYYEGTRREWSIITSHHLKEVDTPWYSFHDSVGEIRMLDSGQVRIGRTAVLFPTWPDGIIGEIVWPEAAWTTAPPDWKVELEIGRRLDEFEDRWRAGDVGGMLQQVEDDCCTVTRVAEIRGEHRVRTVARSKAELDVALSSPEAGRIVELERTNLVLSHYYAFAAYRMQLQLPDRQVEREIAALFPIGPSGLIIGQLSYGFEVRLNG